MDLLKIHSRDFFVSLNYYILPCYEKWNLCEVNEANEIQVDITFFEMLVTLWLDLEIGPLPRRCSGTAHPLHYNAGICPKRFNAYV